MKRLTPEQFFKFHFGFWSNDELKWELTPQQVCGFAAAYAEHLEETAWVSVDKQLPEPIGQKAPGSIHWLSNTVLTVDVATGVRRLARYDVNLKRWHLEPLFDVTHWRPLPNPPNHNLSPVS